MMSIARLLAATCAVLAAVVACAACAADGGADEPAGPDGTAFDGGSAQTSPSEGGPPDARSSDRMPSADADAGADARAPELCRPSDGGAGITGLVAAGSHACFLRSGEVWCWGNDSEGQLGDGQPASAHDTCVNGGECAKSPVKVAGIADAVQIAAGGSTACALRSNGHVACWGYGLMGQLGDGVAVHAPCSVGSTCARSPVDVVGVTDAIEIAVGDEHACALRKSRAVVCWGNDWEGQLGSADAGTEGCQGGSSITYPCSRTPVAVAVPPVDTISAGAVTTCGLASGKVWCWGSNEFGENGSGTIGKAPEPVQVAGLVDAVEISVGYHHACARRSGGTVVCWGWAMDGEMGDGQPTHPSCTGAPCASTPVAVAGLADAVAIDGRFTHTCARRTNGTVVCWGDDRSGEIGDGPTSGSCAEIGACRDAPVAVSNVTDVAAIATGAHFGLFLTRTCELWSTGTNSGAQLGAGDTVSRDAPVRASSVTF